MKTLLKTLAITSASLVSFVSADDATQQTTETKQPMQMITPSAGPRVENAIDGVFTADFIYLIATQGGLNYASNNFDSASLDQLPQGNTYFPNFGFEPGFRVGMGMDLAHDAWDIMAQYTYFHTPTQTRYNDFSNSDYETQDQSDTNTENAKSHWRLKLDVIDLDLGRNYYISQYLALRPFFGAKTAWNRQNYISESEYPSNEVPNYRNFVQHQYAYSIGIRTGLNTSWQFSRNWNVYGNTAFSLMNTHEKVNYKYYGSNDDITYDLNNSIVSEQNTIQPVIELAMGFGYDCFFDDDNYHLGIQVGWEFQYWNNNNYYINETNTNQTQALPFNVGDLSLQGLDVKFRLDF